MHPAALFAGVSPYRGVLYPQSSSLNVAAAAATTQLPTPSPPLVTPGGIAVSYPEKAEALADSRESQFPPVNDPSDPAVIEKVDDALQAYSYAPASEPNLTNPMEVQYAIRGLKVGKAPGPNGLPNRALTHLPQLFISLLVALFNAALLVQYFPTVWKHSG
jgi:hypothetical protein